MDYYLFNVSEKNDVLDKRFSRVKKDNIDYIAYNKFLEKVYGDTIEENEDYIPYSMGQKVIMILNEEQFNVTELENVFEVLTDTLYGGRGNEENSDSEWVSKIG